MPETPSSTSAVYTARPTVKVNGQEKDRLNDLLLGMEMTEQEGGLSTLRLQFSNLVSLPDGDAELAFDDDQILTLGATLTVFAGDERSPTEIFRGPITALETTHSEEDPPELAVYAEDVLQRARMARRTAVYEDRSLADIAREIAGRLSLTPVISGADGSQPVLSQIDESDLSFLRRHLAAVDADLAVIGDELHVAPRDELRRETVELVYGRQLRSARVLVDLAHQVSGVTATGWDARQGQRVSVSSSGSTPGPGSGTDGSTALRQALGDRVEHLNVGPFQSSSEAQALVDAAFAARARRFVQVDGVAEGNPNLRVGVEVSLSGIGRSDNQYRVTRVIHRFDLQRGYKTHFEACSAWWRDA